MTWQQIVLFQKILDVRLVRYWVMLPRFFYPIPDRQCLRGAAPPRYLYGEHPKALEKRVL